MSERLTAPLITAHERVHNALVVPLLHMMDIGAAAPNLCVHIKIHVQW
jgi:hypothetical protein